MNFTVGGFEVIALDIGIATAADTLTMPSLVAGNYIFCGLQVHQQAANDTEFNANINSSHLVVGHRDGTRSTIEGKNTNAGSSNQNDAGYDAVPNGRADLRVVGSIVSSVNTLTWYWKAPGAATWILYNTTGFPPGTQPTYGNTVDIGLITYAYTNTNLPFVGTCESIQYIQN